MKCFRSFHLFVLTALCTLGIAVIASGQTTIVGQFNNIAGGFGKFAGTTPGDLPAPGSPCGDGTTFNPCAPCSNCWTGGRYCGTNNNGGLCYVMYCADAPASDCPGLFLNGGSGFQICRPDIPSGICECPALSGKSSACCACVQTNWNLYWQKQAENWAYFTCKILQQCGACESSAYRDWLLAQMQCAWARFAACKMENCATEAITDIIAEYCAEVCSNTTGSGESEAITPPGDLGLLIQHPELFTPDEASQAVFNYFA